MKRYMKIALMTVVCIQLMGLEAKAQTLENDVFITITDHDMFSRCFATCDANSDGKVTYAEAKKATILGLDLGGRMNIIENYDFLKYFPNLTALSVGNTTVESIDLSMCPKLELLNLTNGLWIKEVILAKGCKPEIQYGDEQGSPKIIYAEAKE